MGPDPSKASPDDFIKYYKACSANYTVQQGKNESVPDFAQRFSEVHHQLEKYIPNVHKTPDGSEIEMIHAFVWKVCPDISKELVSSGLFSIQDSTSCCGDSPEI